MTKATRTFEGRSPLNDLPWSFTARVGMRDTPAEGMIVFDTYGPVVMSPLQLNRLCTEMERLSDEALADGAARRLRERYRKGD